VNFLAWQYLKFAHRIDKRTDRSYICASLELSGPASFGAIRLDAYAKMNVVEKHKPRCGGREISLDAPRVAGIPLDLRTGGWAAPVLLHGRPRAGIIRASTHELSAVRTRFETDGVGSFMLCPQAEAAAAHESEARPLQAGTVPLQGRSE
jgi:hypothetical protein